VIVVVVVVVVIVVAFLPIISTLLHKPSSLWDIISFYYFNRDTYYTTWIPPDEFKVSSAGS